MSNIYRTRKVTGMQVIENPNEEIEPAITSISYGSKEEAEKKIAEYLEGT
jgi:hypothetical protein